MKPKQNPARSKNLIPVRFEYSHPTAIKVCVAGTFNDWNAKSSILQSSGVGNWWKEDALAPGTYEYCLVVEGLWMPDPHARKTVPNPYGGRNSILEVSSLPEAAHIADATVSPLQNAGKSKTQN